MTLVVIGSNGQLGRSLMEAAPDAVPLTHDDIEITDSYEVSHALSKAKPHVVVNAAAYNLVDKAEQKPAKAYKVNALGPRNIARWCEAAEVKLVHISSDFVFGLDAPRNTPYTESDIPGPQSAYAVSKLAGEHYVRSICPRHFVVRTCGLYGATGKPGKGNFVETMLRLSQERDELTVVNDQRCTPTSTADLTKAVLALAETEDYGLYHATNFGSCTWHEFAAAIMEMTNRDTPVREISTEDFGAPAPRPAYSVLSTERLAEVTGVTLPPWRESLQAYLDTRTD